MKDSEIKWCESLEIAPKQCKCKHELIGTGAVFIRSEGLLYCNNCRGIQTIRGKVK